MTSTNSPNTNQSSVARQEEDPFLNIGGGAINEKQRNFQSDSSAARKELARPLRSSQYDPSTTKSHLWHALEGLDRYPNYLSRWTMDDIDRLEEGLEKQLAKVREQRRAIAEHRASFDRMVAELHQNEQFQSLSRQPSSWEELQTILHPMASKVLFGSKNVTSYILAEVLSGQTAVELDPALLEGLMEQECFDVYSFPLLSTDFCQILRNYVRTANALAQTTQESNAANRGGFVTDLDRLGLGWLNDMLFHLFVRPIARHLFQQTESRGDLDWRQGYIAAYSATPSQGKPRQRLVPHTDDSEVTLNVGLGHVFEGGSLNFWGLRNSESGRLVGTFEPQVGVALLHAGRHLHEVTTVTDGDRYAYILWARSWGGVRSQTCPCCWLNRRQDGSCVCGARWN